MTSRHTAARISIVALLVCVATAFSSGWIRHYVGDVVSASLVFGLIGLTVPDRPRLWRALAALMFCGLIEGIQATGLVGPEAPSWLRIVLGATFDPLDLVAYAVGVALAVGAEMGLDGRPLRRRPPRRSGPATETHTARRPR